MTVSSRRNGGSDAMGIGCWKREATSTEIMEVTIHRFLGGLSLSETVPVLGIFAILVQVRAFKTG